MRYIFDIDGTVCTQTDGDYNEAKPLSGRIAKINDLYDEGHTIIMLTARGMGRSNNDVQKSNDLFFDFTKNQLDDWGVKYHALFLGKPAGDLYIDDKGVRDEDFFTD